MFLLSNSKEKQMLMQWLIRRVLLLMVAFMIGLVATHSAAQLGTRATDNVALDPTMGPL